MKKSVLFLCTGNSCRSQMAEEMLRHYHGNRFSVQSAGTNPSKINPYAIRTMQELGIDISLQHSKSVIDFKDQSYVFVVTVCDNAKETCPLFLGDAKRIHWSFVDPADADGDDKAVMAVFRKVRNQIRSKIDNAFGKADSTISPLFNTVLDDTT
jgi:arsenate reductase (thioredoxin)